jgi:crotonobetainyl-CoA:carnitine CoA-transferase CaiB-like acyl-CoA transferase
VIKVGPPGGGPARPGRRVWDRNKRWAGFDPSRDADAEALDRLVAGADIVLAGPAQWLGRAPVTAIWVVMPPRTCSARRRGAPSGNRPAWCTRGSGTPGARPLAGPGHGLELPGLDRPAPGPPPRPGEHSRAILLEAGLDPGEVERLERAGVVFSGRRVPA